MVIEALKQVFDHDDQADEQQLSARGRVAYHQTDSGPIMAGLKRWFDQQFAERLVEPNSRLGKAIAYLRDHWPTLTRFLSVPGAPLDNNLVERALKLFIRQRKNSLFYATEHSAYIASVLTSLIATCLHAGGNVVEYLVALQEHRPEVFGTRRRGCPGPTSRPSPPLNQLSNPEPSGREAESHSTAGSLSPWCQVGRLRPGSVATSGSGPGTGASCTARSLDHHKTAA